jgi:small subunit ribosomal protein S1
VVTAGQEIVVILKFDTEKNRVSLGLKQMGDDGRETATQSTRLFGKITNIADYGAFVELEPGIEGSWSTCQRWTGRTRTSPSKLVAGRRS